LLREARAASNFVFLTTTLLPTKVYACREGLPSASTPGGMPPEASADGCSIVAQGILLNLELVVLAVPLSRSPHQSAQTRGLS
jgi:hypothetical protein